MGPCTLSNLNLNSEGKYDPTIQKIDSFWPYDTEISQNIAERYNSNLMCVDYEKMNSSTGLNLHGNEQTDYSKEVVISLIACGNASTCASFEEQNTYFRGKSIVILFNERVLALDEQRTSIRYLMEDAFDIDMWDFGMSVRQKVKQ